MTSRESIRNAFDDVAENVPGEFPPPTLINVPTVGRIVHYVSVGGANGNYPSRCRAAVVTETHLDEEGLETALSLCVLNPTGMFFNTMVPWNGGGAPGTWHWPEGTKEAGA